MGFFLLGRARKDGELALIAHTVYGSRQEALEALTALSSDPAFLHRDSDVFVADLDAATPVLLVASAVPAAASAPEEEPVVPEPVEDADVWEAPSEVSAEEGPGLAGALKRAAGALESEGIVAPDSIGPEPEAEPETESEAESAPEAEGVKPSPDSSWPWDAAVATDSTEAVPATQEQESVQAETLVYVPDPFEEPSVDGGDLLQVRADDETVALGRPVVMGAYAEEVVGLAQEPEVPAEPELPGEPEVVQPSDEMTELPVIDSTGVFEDSQLDGILADLEPIENVSAGGEATPRSLDALTCNDCVYENTCPNKEELDPSRCGNFQWKSQ